MSNRIPFVTILVISHVLFGGNCQRPCSRYMSPYQEFRFFQISPNNCQRNIGQWFSIQKEMKFVLMIYNLKRHYHLFLLIMLVIRFFVSHNNRYERNVSDTDPLNTKSMIPKYCLWKCHRTVNPHTHHDMSVSKYESHVTHPHTSRMIT